MSSESGTILFAAEKESKFSRHNPMTQPMRQEEEDLEKEEAAFKAKKEAAALKAQKREEVRLQTEAEELAAATKAQEEADAAGLKAAAPVVIELAERANEVVAVVLAKEAAAAPAAAEVEEVADETPDIPAQIASLHADILRLNEGLTLCQGFSEAKRGTMTANFQGQIDEVVSKIGALQARAAKAVDLETVTLAVATDEVKADDATTAAVEGQPVVAPDVLKAAEALVAAKGNDFHAMISAFVAERHKVLDIFAGNLHAQLDEAEFGFGVVGADVVTVDAAA